MIDSTKYNGWANYETWAVKLWIDNDERVYNYWQDAARFSRKIAPLNKNVPRIWTKEEAARYVLADRLKNEISDASPNLGASMWADLMGAALSEVNWDEIARSLLEE